MAYLVFGAVIGGMVLFGLVSWAIERAAKSVKVSGAPTPAEAKIEQEGDAVQAAIDAQAAKDKAEVANASGSDLLALARERLLRSKIE